MFGSRTAEQLRSRPSARAGERHGDCVVINLGGAQSLITRTQNNEVGNENLYCDNFIVNVGNKFPKFILRHSLMAGRVLILAGKIA